MKFLKFQYKDLKGKITNREALVVSEPTDKISCIDVSEINDQDIAQFAHQYDLIKSAFIAEVEALQASFELKHRYRQFFPDKMVVEQEEVL